MLHSEVITEKLFSYGTLQYENVQLSTFGRKLVGTDDYLIGYKLSRVQITDPKVLALSGEAIHSILIYTGSPHDRVAGMVFNVSQEELHAADQYEVSDYKRVSAKLFSGIDCWVYVSH